MRRGYGFFAAVLAMLLLLSACGQKADNSVLQSTISTPADVAAVAIYKKQCISCHAHDLSGRVGPALQIVGSAYTAEQLATIIGEGSGRGMPAYGNRLDQDEIEALAQWLAKMK
ncbi:c-type cytochrome [Paenibacillus sp. NPDC057967]|uniref:c-type cytochrome n=1 Tax=Paenibacillus sp. NPDC057967 TaxID=3346293 RepID=UPI0036D81E7D